MTLRTHAAAMDIEAVLAQLPYATRHTLRDDDFSYLVESLKNWSDHATRAERSIQPRLLSFRNKKEDIRIFCKGADFARKSLGNPTPFQQAWRAFCRIRR